MRFLLSLALAASIIIAGCTTSQQTTEYKTIAATEAAVNTAFNGYLDLVVNGKIPTNSVPQVSRAYNAFQAGANTAVITHGLNLTNLPPADLAQLAANLFTIINAVEGK